MNSNIYNKQEFTKNLCEKMQLLPYFEYYTMYADWIMSLVSKYEKVKSNAGCTCSGDLTYCDRYIRGYNEFRLGQNIEKKEKRDAKCKKGDMYRGLRRRYEKGVAICTGTTQNLIGRSHAVLRKSS